MARFRNKVLASRRGRGSGRRHLPGHPKGPGRKRMSTKVIAPEPLPYEPPRRITTLPTRPEIGQGYHLQTLKEQTQAIEARLRYLDKRISEIEQGSTPSAFIAFVDSDRCVGCGICQDMCPASAISVDEIARVDPKRCIGCGNCVEECPMGALALRPL